MQFGATKIAAQLKPQLPYEQVTLTTWYWFLYYASQPFEGRVDVLLDPLVVCPIMYSLLTPKDRKEYVRTAFTVNVGNNTDIMDAVATWALHCYEMYPSDVSVDACVQLATQRANSTDIDSTWQKVALNFIYTTLCNVEYIKDPQLMRLLALIFAKFDFKLHNQYSVLLFYIYDAYVKQTVPTQPFLYVHVNYALKTPWLQATQVGDRYYMERHRGIAFKLYDVVTGPHDCVYLPQPHGRSAIYYVSDEEGELGVEYQTTTTPYFILKANTHYQVNIGEGNFPVACLNFDLHESK